MRRDAIALIALWAGCTTQSFVHEDAGHALRDAGDAGTPACWNWGPFGADGVPPPELSVVLAGADSAIVMAWAYQRTHFSPAETRFYRSPAWATPPMLTGRVSEMVVVGEQTFVTTLPPNSGLHSIDSDGTQVLHYLSPTSLLLQGLASRGDGMAAIAFDDSSASASYVELRGSTMNMTPMSFAPTPGAARATVITDASIFVLDGRRVWIVPTVAPDAPAIEQTVPAGEPWPETVLASAWDPRRDQWVILGYEYGDASAPRKLVAYFIDRSGSLAEQVLLMEGASPQATLATSQRGSAWAVVDSGEPIGVGFAEPEPTALAPIPDQEGSEPSQGAALAMLYDATYNGYLLAITPIRVGLDRTTHVECIPVPEP